MNAKYNKETVEYERKVGMSVKRYERQVLEKKKLEFVNESIKD